MTLANDPTDFAPRPPGRRSGPMSPWFGFFLGSGVTCVVVAIFFVFGARLFPAKPAAQPQQAPDAVASHTGAESAASTASLPTASSSGTVAAPAAIGARMDRLEAGRRTLLDAAAEALAAASLSQAADSGRPFVNEFDALAKGFPDLKDVGALRPLAERGAPSVSVLTAEYPEAARRAVYASHAPADDAGLLARITHAISVLFTVRRTNHLTGADPDAITARAEHKLNDGDLEGAVRELDQLPPPGKEAIATWRDRALRRVQIQSRISAIRMSAIRNLAAVNQGSGQ